MTMPMSTPISIAELALIKTQLGRPPRGIVSIAASNSSGLPLVLQMRSWLDDAPFPTLYWLSSKDLHKAISQIETDGFIKQLQQRIADDETLRARLLADQRRYRDNRLVLMHSDDRNVIASNGFSELFDSWGIGGIKEWDNVRCLHMHYAHHLADGNIIGEILDQEFQLHSLLDGLML
jgi:hypothetical protein